MRKWDLMRIREAGTAPGAAADESGRPTLTVVSGQGAEPTPTGPVDLEMLRALGWGDTSDPGVVSIQGHRLRRAGLVERTTGGHYRLTPAGVDLLDDDF